MFSADRKQPFTSPGDLAERNGFAGLASYYYPVVKKLAEYAKNIDPKSTPAPAIAGDDRERRYAAKKKSVLDMLADPTPFTVRNGPNYVLVIDEINRGNISKIMGELITLLEDDKRLGAAHELRVQLPCSKEWFCLPPNLHIIGTMNTADRSIALMDVALRRRFNKYEELMPNPSLVPDYARPYFEAINNHIEYFFDRDHQIGHSYFMQADSAKALRDALCDKVVPLLQEYFYGAWDKVCMVLGCPHDRNADGEPCIVKCTPIKVRADDEDSEPKLRFEIDKDFREATSDSEIERYLNRILPQGGQG
jgi:5-methylcytosine-specific restriction protein B